MEFSEENISSHPFHIQCEYINSYRIANKADFMEAVNLLTVDASKDTCSSG